MTPLRRKMIEDMRLAGLTSSTQQVYVQAIATMARRLGKGPQQMSEEELRQYFVYLTTERKVSRSSWKVAICASKFLFGPSGFSVGTPYMLWCPLAEGPMDSAASAGGHGQAGNRLSEECSQPVDPRLGQPQRVAHSRLNNRCAVAHTAHRPGDDLLGTAGDHARGGEAVGIELRPRHGADSGQRQSRGQQGTRDADLAGGWTDAGYSALLGVIGAHSGLARSGSPRRCAGQAGGCLGRDHRRRRLEVRRLREAGFDL